MYSNYLETLDIRFKAAFSTIDTVYSFDCGPELEIALCNVLRDALPQKFGICRGFAVDRSGNLFGDDIIIYDHMALPTLAVRSSNEFLRKERIPIEAIYCYIEVKNTINIQGCDSSSLNHAFTQVTNVKKLCSQRKPVSLTQLSPGINFGSMIALYQDIVDTF